MASKESLGRVRHFNLISQQLRLRHLRSISVRNVVPRFSISGECLLDRLIETYFTLHSVEGHQNAIYTSEKIKYSLNPTWASFDPSAWLQEQSTAMTSFLVRIWGGQNEKFRVIIEWEVHLPSLQYLGDQVKSSKYGQNTVIFGLIDGYYGAPSVKKLNKESSFSSLCASVLQTENNHQVAVSQRKDVIKVDLDQVQTSYNISSLQRLQMTQKAIQQTQLSVKDVCRSIESKVESDLKCISQLSEEEMLTLKIKLLREDFLSKQKLLLKERKEEQGILEKLQQQELNLKRNKEQLDVNKSCLREHKPAYIERRESLVKLNAQLNMRRRQLISELMSIYPIIELQGTKEHLICGVRLPNCESDEFTAMDDDTLAVALGYTCHLVSMIAKFLELPLRYPVNFHGSKSTVMDFTSEKVPEKDRKFPLYNKGKEVAKFFYGTFLLNKNIAQIRQFNGLGTPNLRNTLPNLKDLLNTRFRSSDPVKSAPLTIIRKSPIKHQKNRSSTPESGGSRESSPQSNPKPNDFLLNESASEAKSAVVDPTAKSALPNQPANPDSEDALVKPASPDKPAKPPLPDKPAKPPLPDKPTKPALPDKPAKLALLDKPAKPALPVKPTKPALHDQLGKPPLPLKPAKPALRDQLGDAALPAPLSAAPVHQIQTAEMPLATANNSNTLGLLEGEVVDHRQRTVTVDSALHIPSQGTSRFLGHQRMKKSQKHQGNATTTVKPHRTVSLKARRSNTSEKQKLVKSESVDIAANVKKGVSPNCAENAVNDLIEFEGKNISGLKQAGGDETNSCGQGEMSASNGDQFVIERDSDTNIDVLARPNGSVVDKQFRSDGMRSKSLFAEEGSIDFDICENGEIDLR